MRGPSNVVPFLRPNRESFNILRSLNESLRSQVAYFHGIERRLAIELQTGTDVSAITTEGEASSYIGSMTLTLYSEGVRDKERRYQELIERKYLAGLTAEDQLALNAVTHELSEIDEDFYRPVIERLKNRIRKSRTPEN